MNSLAPFIVVAVVCAPALLALVWLKHSEPVLISKRTFSRPMTDADWERLDAAFAKIEEAFDELRKIKP